MLLNFRKLFRARGSVKKYSENRSEEVRDIIDRMPLGFGRWVAIAVLVFTFLFFVFSLVIKYPDAVSGQIKINSDNMPVKLVANSVGKLHIFDIQPQAGVKENDYIAVIQNSAKTEDVLYIKKLLNVFGAAVDSLQMLIHRLPSNISLGDLNIQYYTFLDAVQKKWDFNQRNIYEQQFQILKDNIKWRNRILAENRKILKTVKEKNDILYKWEEKYKLLNQKEIIHEYEYDKEKNEYLAVRQEMETLLKEIVSVQSQLVEDENNLQRIKIEEREQKRQLQLNLLLAYQELVDNIKSWEQKYVFIAPFDGKVEYLKFLGENQFIQTGEEIFSILPQENEVLGQMFLPANGAGKVRVGDRVVIKLDNYPYNEFGAVDGIVGAISLVSQEQVYEQNKINMYLVMVDLPQGLTTNYGSKLDFKYEIQGKADIVVKERRLIERLFDNLKYNTR